MKVEAKYCPNKNEQKLGEASGTCETMLSSLILLRSPLPREWCHHSDMGLPSSMDSQDNPPTDVTTGQCIADCPSLSLFPGYSGLCSNLLNDRTLQWHLVTKTNTKDGRGIAPQQGLTAASRAGSCYYGG